MRRLIAVVGPHRTGTSATTKVIAAMGASLGEGVLIPGDAHEYYENMALAQTHHKLFEAFGVSWDAPFLPKGWAFSDVTRLANGQVKKILAKDYPGDKTYVLKSPLMCILRPLWRGIDLTVVKTFRSPWETYESLQAVFKRDAVWAMGISDLYLEGQKFWGAEWRVKFRELWDQDKMEKLQKVLDLPTSAFLSEEEAGLVHFGPKP